VARFALVLAVIAGVVIALAIILLRPADTSDTGVGPASSRDTTTQPAWYAAQVGAADPGSAAPVPTEPLFGPHTPARVSGGWVHIGVVAEGGVEQLGELMFETSGAVAMYQVTSDDSRLTGTATATGGWIGWYPPALVAVVETRWLIKGEVGAWTGSSERVASMGDNDPINVDEQLILVGSGTYEGLTAYVILDSDAETFQGAIIPDEMPELPDDWMEIYQSQAGEDPVTDT
jgi:hypothetical protein